MRQKRNLRRWMFYLFSILFCSVQIVQAASYHASYTELVLLKDEGKLTFSFQTNEKVRKWKICIFQNGEQKEEKLLHNTSKVFEIDMPTQVGIYSYQIKGTSYPYVCSNIVHYMVLPIGGGQMIERDFYRTIHSTGEWVDSDKDGLPNLYEEKILGTNPYEKDTDANGVQDGEEDQDQDGLTNLQEYKLGTNPLDAYTDTDDVPDGKEVNIDKTNPLEEEKKAPQIEEEVLTSSYFQEELVTNNPAYPIITVRRLKKDRDGLTVTIPSYAFLKNTSSILGYPISIEEDAVLQIHLKFKVMHPSIEDLLICSYDTKNRTIKPLVTTIQKDTNTIEAKTNHTGIYFVLDRKKWLENLGIKKEWLLKQLAYEKTVVIEETNIEKSPTTIVFSDLLHTADLKQLPNKQEDVDTDEDGLLDTQELSSTYPLYQSLDAFLFPNNEMMPKFFIKTYVVKSNPAKKDTDEDGYQDKEDLDPVTPFITPVIFLHGRTSNNDDCFAIQTPITLEENTQYHTPNHLTVKRKYNYLSIEDQKIQAVTRYATKKQEADEKVQIGLAYELKLTGKYKENKNLFSFNYPNSDMIGLNGVLFGKYVQNLFIKAQNTKKLASTVFPTKEALKTKNAKIDVIAHSQGGLITRYWIENECLDQTIVRKLIMIDTPHYGASIAAKSKYMPIAFKPCDLDLAPTSQLFTGKIATQKGVLGSKKYALMYQSKQLKGVHKGVCYYAIVGYDVGDNEYKKDKNNQLENVIEWKNTIHTKDILIAFMEQSLREYKNLILPIKEERGDNIVSLTSQAGIAAFSPTYVPIEKGCVNVDISGKYDLLKSLHVYQQHRLCIGKKVIQYLAE